MSSQQLVDFVREKLKTVCFLLIYSSLSEWVHIWNRYLVICGDRIFAFICGSIFN